MVVHLAQNAAIGVPAGADRIDVPNLIDVELERDPDLALVVDALRRERL